MPVPSSQVCISEKPPFATGTSTMKPVRSCVIFLSGILLALGGHAFATTPVVQAEPERGLAFGAFDITESDLAVTHAVLMRIKPAKLYMGSSGERATVTYTNGEFYSPNLAPGLYSVMGFFWATSSSRSREAFGTTPSRWNPVTSPTQASTSSTCRKEVCSEAIRALSLASTQRPTRGNS